MIKAVIFDFFGVICSDEYWRFVKQDRQADTVFRDYTDEVNLGDISWSDFISKIADATHTSLEEVEKLYESEKIDPRMVQWISELHKDYKTGLITNAHSDFIDPILSKSHLGDHLDSVVVSSRAGVIKPDPAIFKTALKELDVKPEEAVFIDDLDRHVIAAQNIGMKAFRFADYKQAKGQLKAILDHS